MTYTKITPEIAREWAALLHSGLTQIAASDTLHVRRASVRDSCRKWGIDYPRRGRSVKFTDDQKRAAVRRFNRARADGCAVRLSETQSGHSASSVLKWSIQLGMTIATPPARRTWWEIQALFFYGSGTDLYGRRV